MNFTRCRVCSVSNSAPIRASASSSFSPDRYRIRYAVFSAAISSGEKPGPPQPHQVQALRPHVEIRIQKERRNILFTREFPPIIASRPIFEY